MRLRLNVGGLTHEDSKLGREGLHFVRNVRSNGGLIRWWRQVSANTKIEVVKRQRLIRDPNSRGQSRTAIDRQGEIDIKSLRHVQINHLCRDEIGMRGLIRGWALHLFTRQQKFNFSVIKAQTVSSLAKGLRIPLRIFSCCNILDPTVEAMHGPVCKPDQFTAGRLLLSQPGIEQLLQGPGCFTKFTQTHHA